MDQGTKITNNNKIIFDSGLKILLVDDNKVNQFLGRRILNNLGIHLIEVASSGPEAFEKIKTSLFDVILTDVEMPGMTGYELSKKIRETESLGSHITIIALTANASDEDRENARLAGIDDYLTKPYSPQDLLDVLNKNVVNRKHLLMEDIHPTEAVGMEKLYAVFNHNQNDIRQFLQMLHQQLPQLIGEIKTGISEKNKEKTFHAAHKLKSPVKLLAHPALATEFSDFTENLRETNDLSFTEKIFSGLEPDLEGLLMMINTELERLSS